MTTKNATKKTSSKKVSKKVSKKKVSTKSKMDQCAMIMDKMFQGYCDGEIARKDILEKFMAAGMSKAYASTAFQILKARILNDEQ